MLESGALFGWLCGGLIAAGLPAVCIEAGGTWRAAAATQQDRPRRCPGSGASRPDRLSFGRVFRWPPLAGAQSAAKVRFHLTEEIRIAERPAGALVLAEVICVALL
ncbi:MAG: hypothetical protein WAS21_31220 [Geminicoccaceae bacterium]